MTFLEEDEAASHKFGTGTEEESPWVFDEKAAAADDDDDDDSEDDDKSAFTDASLWSGLSEAVAAYGRLPKEKIADKFMAARPRSGFTRKEVLARISAEATYDKSDKRWRLDKPRTTRAGRHALEESDISNLTTEGSPDVVLFQVT